MYLRQATEQRIEILEKINKTFEGCAGCPHDEILNNHRKKGWDEANRYCRNVCEIGQVLQQHGNELLEVSRIERTYASKDFAG